METVAVSRGIGAPFGLQEDSSMYLYKKEPMRTRKRGCHLSQIQGNSHTNHEFELFSTMPECVACKAIGCAPDGSVRLVKAKDSSSPSLLLPRFLILQKYWGKVYLALNGSLGSEIQFHGMYSECLAS